MIPLVWINFFKKNVHPFFLKPEVWIITAGILLRTKHLLENRSLWLDETCAALSIVNRSYLEIFSNQEMLPEFARSPMGFILIVKSLIILLGNTEVVLRLFPFICSIGTLILFSKITKDFLTQRASLLALAFLALAEPLVYYSAELKQYSTDLLCTIIVVNTTYQFLLKEFRIKDCIVLGLVGGGLLWISNSLVFVLAGVGLVLFLNKPWQKGRNAMIALVATGMIWLINFLLLYYVSLRFMVGNTVITDTWKGAMCTSPLFSLTTLQWLWSVIIESFISPVGLKWWWFFFPCFISGIWLLSRKDKNIVLLWVLPIALTLLAALLGKYPFYGRVILFLTAGYYVIIACSIDKILSFIESYNNKFTFAFILLFYFHPIAEAAHSISHSHSRTDNRQVMEFLAVQYKPGDYVYLNTLAHPPFLYYAGKTGLSKSFNQPVIGIGQGELIRGFKISKFALDPNDVNGHQCMFFRTEYNVFDLKGMFRANMGSTQDVNKIGVVPLDLPYRYPPTGRTWLVLSGPGALENDVNTLILQSFNKTARPLLFLEGLNAGVYLYDIQ